MLKLVLDEQKSKTLCEKAVGKMPRLLQYAPDECKTKERCVKELV